MTADDAPKNAHEIEETPAAEAKKAAPAAAPEAATENETTDAPVAPAEPEIEAPAAPAAEAEAPAKPAEPPAEASDAPAALAEPATEASEAPAKPAAEAPEPEPVFDPDSCKAIAIGLPAFWDAVLDGEFEGTDFQYYLEPAGVLKGPLVCTRAPENEPEIAGLLMTRAGWQAKKVCLDDDVNPETYELSFPKEFGYIKTLSHYQPETRKSAKYPWSKKY